MPTLFLSLIINKRQKQCIGTIFHFSVAFIQQVLQFLLYVVKSTSGLNCCARIVGIHAHVHAVAAWLLYGRGGTHENGAPPPPPLSRTHKPEALLMNSCPPSADSTSGGGGGGGAVRLRPIQRAGGGAVRLRPIQRAGGGVLSAFGRFNERGGGGGGGGGEVTVIDRAHAHAQYRRVNLLI